MDENWMADFNAENIRELPWIKSEDLERLGATLGVILLPDVSVVIRQAQNVFESSREVEGYWKSSGDFVERDDVRNFLRTLMVAFQTLNESASHTDVYCEFLDDNGNLCGSKMDIAVDPNGAYYVCRAYPGTHRVSK